MRRSIIVGVVVGAALVVCSPAGAAAPEISQKSCQAADGTFTRDQGTKTCTTTSVAPVTGWPTESSILGGSFGTGIQYTAVYSFTDQVQTTTIQSQKGNGPVTTTQSTTVLSTTTNEISCTGEILFQFTVVSSSTLPLVECESLNLFPPDSTP